MRYSNIRAWARASVLTLTIALAGVYVTGGGSVATTTAAGGAAQTAAAESTGGPLFGGTVYERPGESYEAAFKRVSQTYGGSLGAVRMFFPGMPKSWSSITSKIGSTPVVASFRPDPGAVIAGRHDSELRQWFANAPTNRPTFWTYWHEPEDNNVNGAQYRQAWRHINNLAEKAGNPRLKSTLILMCWTLDPKSGRDWRNYYAGNDVIDVLGFDCYNGGRKRGVYRDVAGLLDPVAKLARSLGKPWGIGEFGSTVVTSDGGTQGRAQWLREYANYVRTNGGAFATYFDSVTDLDFRLTDDPSRTAWRDIVQSS